MSTDKLDVPVAFGASKLTTGADGSVRIVVPTDAKRGGAKLAARLHRPGVVRDALLAMGDVLSSDLRRKANDRADYLAYLISKGKGVGKAVWDAQKEYLALQYSAAAKTEEPLDPVLTVSADALRFEVLSRDEATYAQLVLARPAALVDAKHPGDSGRDVGTTFVELDSALSSIVRMRSYRPTTLELEPAEDGLAAEKSRTVPLRWLRAFGQMQAATLLAADRFELAPIDLYNVLLTLRMKKARTAPRGLRYELVPGEVPRLVLEPWDLVVKGTGGPYRGTTPRVIRTWGRNRLNVLARVLPHAKKLTVSIAGPGLPALYTVDMGDASLSLALSGWTDAGWAGVSTFDLLAADDDAAAVDAVVAALDVPRTEGGISERIGKPVRQALLAGLAQLRIGHDLASGEYFARPLLATPVPPSALKFRDAREAAAHRLLGEANSVTVTKVHDQGADGRTIEGQVVDAKAHRTFYPAFTIDREGRTAQATCTCNVFRRSGIKEGPCEHMIALRVQYTREQAKLEAERETPEGRARITAETRVLLRRTGTGAETFRLSLDGRFVISRFGTNRVQRLRFDSASDARNAYFSRLSDLAKKGYLDATQD